MCRSTKWHAVRTDSNIGLQYPDRARTTSVILVAAASCEEESKG